MSATVDAGDAVQSLVSGYESTLSSVSIKAVGSQLVLMSVLSLGTLMAFSVLRPRDKRVYAPKVKYVQAAEEQDPTLHLQPPPEISNGIFSWFSPVLHVAEKDMLQQIGLDGVTFLRCLRLLRVLFLAVSILVGGILLPINVVYNLKKVSANSRNYLSLLTIQNLDGNILWAHVAVVYVITLLVCYSVWYHWKKMILLRQAWFRSDEYQQRIYSRTLMVTQVPKEFRTDEGLVHLMGKLKVDGIKIGQQIDCTSIGRRLDDFPELIEEHNEAVRNLEETLVKYLKGNQIGTKRPQITKGGFLGCGGETKDAIKYYSQQVKFLRDRIDQKRADIDALIRKDRQARKQKKQSKPHGENYGFVTLKTISEAHRIARAHRGSLKELGGATIQLAPSPHDLIWKNVPLEPNVIAGRKLWGFLVLGVVCFLHTLPLLFVSLLANLSSLTVYVAFLRQWKESGQFGNWTFSVVSGVLPSVIQAIFGFFLPILMRRLSKYQGALTRSRLNRAVIARYFAFMIISNLIIFSLLGVVYNAVAQVITQIGEHKSASEIFDYLGNIPDNIQGTYVQQSTYWLTVFPLRGFLVIFEIVQLIKLLLLSVQRLLFAKTPRDIKEYTKPPFFEYAIVITNMLFLAAIGLVYAPLAPLVCIGVTLVFWVSSAIYKYQLLYVYVSRAESGGRLFNVFINRLIACAIFMQLLMLLTIGLNRRRYTDVIATVPSILILLAFKIFMARPLEKQFTFYEPTAQEAEEEFQRSLSEKRINHHELEKRFLHPALQSNMLFAVMVHKSQEALAREVLSEYPWFNKSRHNPDAIDIKAVKPENLDFNPAKDDLRNEATWETQSIASTQMLDGKSEFGSMRNSPDINAYLERGTMSRQNSQSAFGDVPLESSDNLLQREYEAYVMDERPQRQPSVARYNQRAVGDDHIAVAPLLQRQESNWSNKQSHYDTQSAYEQTPFDAPYPPTSFNFHPNGYAPPAMSRTGSQSSVDSRDGRTHGLR
ncbi:hypothetical protein NliqN6_2781 [Naganishia liquefaciens]|uniref:DUF221-domain-containing protein n=1 Tax=Naganishia liquefaciens TaxID=104408 RepID=A0A8H3YEE4_9TREE|nr:hypothetical protein NliqN6_2781 [Naganishia liquefaciens]